MGPFSSDSLRKSQVLSLTSDHFSSLSEAHGVLGRLGSTINKNKRGFIYLLIIADSHFVIYNLL